MFVATAAWLYVLFTVALWIGLRVAGDRWWPATLVLFGPRWVFVLPYLFLLPAAGLLRLRCSWGLVFGIGITFFSLMGLCVPWRALLPGGHAGPRVRVLTCNTHGEELDTAAFARLIASEQPDVVALQGWSAIQRSVLFGEGHWYILLDGELCLASRSPVRKREELIAPRTSPRESAIYYDVDFPFGTVPIIDLHLASPHVSFLALLTQSPQGPVQVQANSANRMEQSRRIGQRAEALGPSVLMLGDFNTPPDSPVFDEGWSAFTDAFTAAGFGFGYTYFEGGTAARIDHIMAGPAWRCRRSWVGPKVGSPHRPLLADIQWMAHSI